MSIKSGKSGKIYNYQMCDDVYQIRKEWKNLSIISNRFFRTDF